jgi:hypothetical protein
MKDFVIWKEVLKGRQNATLESFPNLNHLFMYVEGKSTGEEYQRAGHLDQTALQTIVDWVKKHSY